MALQMEFPTSTTADWTAVAAGVAAELRARAASHDRSGEIDRDAFDRLRESGLTRVLVPADHGGGGASHAEAGAVLRAIGRRDPSTAVTLSMHTHLIAAQVWRHNHGVDASGVFSKVAGGAILVSTGASDWVGSNGHARRVDGGWRVSARKSPASGCEVGDVLVTSVRHDGTGGSEVVHCSVPLSAEGVAIDATWDTLGLRATGSHTVVLDDVFVPDAAVSLVRPADEWHPVWNVVIGAAMPLIMAAYVGVADAAVEAATAAVAGRDDPHLITLSGEMVNAHVTGADVVDAMFAAGHDLSFDATDEHAALTLSRKTVAADALIETVRLALEVVGGVGFTRASDVERLLRDVHGCLFHPLPRARQLQFTGRVHAGLPPVG